jgi:branched-chain amino acid transport system permease protein
MAGMSFDLIALQLFTGLALGAIYVLFAIGLSLIFGMLTVVNFAHGAFYMVGAYVGLFLLAGWKLLAMPCGGSVDRRNHRTGGAIPDPAALWPRDRLSIVADVRPQLRHGRTGSHCLWQSGYPFDTPEILQGAVNIGVGYFPLYRLFIIGVAAAVLLGLWLFLERTSFGLIIRAGARDPQIVRVLGVNVSRVWLFVFGIGSGIAALAGLLAAPLQGVIPEMGSTILAEASRRRLLAAWVRSGAP